MFEEDDWEQDWVTLRSKCSIQSIFELLASRIEADVNKMKEAGGNYTFEFTKDFERVFIGKKTKGGSQTGFVEMTLGTENTINIREFRHGLQGNVNELMVTYEWRPEECVCCMLVNEEERDAWEISQLALGGFFFN